MWCTAHHIGCPTRQQMIDATDFYDYLRCIGHTDEAAWMVAWEVSVLGFPF